jgi:hypothetical protein
MHLTERLLQVGVEEDPISDSELEQLRQDSWWLCRDTEMHTLLSVTPIHTRELWRHKPLAATIPNREDDG